MTDEARAVLSTVDPNSLDALFAKDPLELTDLEILAIVEKLQADRERMMAAPPPKERKTTTTKSTFTEAPMSIEDLLSKMGSNDHGK